VAVAFLQCLVDQLAESMCWATATQGLEVDSNKRPMARPHRMQRQQWVEEQRAWGAASDKRSAQYIETIAFRSGKVVGGAGKPATGPGHL
jgi:hypothetical protein